MSVPAPSGSTGQELGELIAQLDLSDLQQRFIRLRWLDQVQWVENAASRARRWYRALRLTTVVGAVLVPALIGVNAGGAVGETARWAAFALGLLVAICAAVEEFFHFGDHWLHYRRVAERLKTEGWNFFQLSGPYRRFNPHHTAAYPAFAERVERTLQQDVDLYVTEVAREKEKQEEKGED